MSDSKTTDLWRQLSVTPEQNLKAFKRAGGFSGKSIDPTYRLQRLTETFGPCGIGWRFVTTKMWREEYLDKPVVYVTGYLWYVLDGKKYRTCSHTGGTEATRTPDEAYKMAETDALGKCALDIGLAADVYLGLHDGDKYQKPSGDSVPEPPEKPWFDQFDKMEARFLEAIGSGERTPQQILENLEQGFRLNKKDRARILALGSHGVGNGK